MRGTIGLGGLKEQDVPSYLPFPSPYPHSIGGPDCPGDPSRQDRLVNFFGTSLLFPWCYAPFESFLLIFCIPVLLFFGLPVVSLWVSVAIYTGKLMLLIYYVYRALPKGLLLIPPSQQGFKGKKSHYKFILLSLKKCFSFGLFAPISN